MPKVIFMPNNYADKPVECESRRRWKRWLPSWSRRGEDQQHRPAPAHLHLHPDVEDFLAPWRPQCQQPPTYDQVANKPPSPGSRVFERPLTAQNHEQSLSVSELSNHMDEGPATLDQERYQAFTTTWTHRDGQKTSTGGSSLNSGGTTMAAPHSFPPVNFDAEPPAVMDKFMIKDDEQLSQPPDMSTHCSTRSAPTPGEHGCYEKDSAIASGQHCEAENLHGERCFPELRISTGSQRPETTTTVPRFEGEVSRASSTPQNSPNEALSPATRLTGKRELPEDSPVSPVTPTSRGVEHATVHREQNHMRGIENRKRRNREGFAYPPDPRMQMWYQSRHLN